MKLKRIAVVVMSCMLLMTLCCGGIAAFAAEEVVFGIGGYDKLSEITMKDNTAEFTAEFTAALGDKKDATADLSDKISINKMTVASINAKAAGTVTLSTSGSKLAVSIDQSKMIDGKPLIKTEGQMTSLNYFKVDAGTKFSNGSATVADFNACYSYKHKIWVKTITEADNYGKRSVQSVSAVAPNAINFLVDYVWETAGAGFVHGQHPNDDFLNEMAKGWNPNPYADNGVFVGMDQIAARQDLLNKIYFKNENCMDGEFFNGEMVAQRVIEENKDKVGQEGYAATLEALENDAYNALVFHVDMSNAQAIQIIVSGTAGDLISKLFDGTAETIIEIRDPVKLFVLNPSVPYDNVAEGTVGYGYNEIQPVRFFYDGAKGTMDSYKVTLESNINGAGTLLGSGEVNKMSKTHTVTAQANKGYVFKGWAETSNLDKIVSTDAAYTFDLKGNISLTAVFEKETFSLTIPEGVTVTDKNGTALSSDSKLYVGDKLTITAAEKEGYTFKLTVNGDEFESGNVYTVRGNVEIAITYVEATDGKTDRGGCGGSIGAGVGTAICCVFIGLGAAAIALKKRSS